VEIICPKPATYGAYLAAKMPAERNCATMVARGKPASVQKIHVVFALNASERSSSEPSFGLRRQTAIVAVELLPGS